MTDQEYHSDRTHISKTMLNLFYKSPVEYYHTYITGLMEEYQPNAAMQLGTIGHAVLLEQKDLDELIAVYPDFCLKSNGALKSDAAEAFQNLNRDKICLKERELEPILKFIEGVSQHELLMEAIEHASSLERRFNAEIEGVKCKCKPDIACDMGQYVLVPDLKFSEDISPDQFRRSAKRLRYWLQDAHYSKVLSENFGGKPVVFKFYAIETKFPFRMKIYAYEPRSREIAADNHAGKLRDLKVCMDTGVWEDNWEGDLHLNNWEFNDDDQMVEIGEES